MRAVRTSAALATIALAIAALGSAIDPPNARADSSEWNLHLDAAFATPLSGMLQPADGAMIAAGFFAWGSLDWQAFAPLAFELAIGLGHMENFGGPDPQPDGTLLQGALGIRIRLFDDEAGYATQQGGNAHGNAWISAHAGAMAWNGPQLSIDAAIGYEWSLLDPFSLGIFARGVLGLLGDDSIPDFVLSAGLALSFEVHTGIIPDGRYGVSDVRVEGLEDLDEAALRACLGTRERAQLGFDFGASSDLTCGEPPFGSDRWRVDLFAWPWTEWPLFDASVFERDVLRVERWLRARGYYEGRVVASTVEPTEALGEAREAPRDPSDGTCIADATRGCQARVELRIEEGEPVRVARTEIRGVQTVEPDEPGDPPAQIEVPLPRPLRQALRAVMELRDGGVFDESIYQRSQRQMVRVLADEGYSDAVVRGDVKINVARHEAHVQFQVETGRRGVIGRICVTGHGELPPEPLLAATYLAAGQTFSLSRIEEAQRAIFALGVVSGAEIRHRTDAEERAAEERAREQAESDDPGAGIAEVENPEPIVDPEALPAEEPPAPIQEEEARDASGRAHDVEPGEGGSDATPASEHEPGSDRAPGSDASRSENEQGEPEAEERGASADPEEAEEAPVGAPAAPPYCVEPARTIEEDENTRSVDLEIRVRPGRLERIGLGAGIQIGDTLSFGSTAAGTSSSATSQQAYQQWDVHLLLIAEWWNLFGDMLRLRLEERPRLIFPAPFPGVESESGLTPNLGNKIQLSIRWPAFLEPRTALFASLAHDYGPLPLYGFFRHELDARIGLERTFFDGRLYTSFAIHGNLFVPEQGLADLRRHSQRETTRALILEQTVTLDLRDDPRNPSAGAFFAIGAQETGIGGISSWDSLRLTAEGRGYVPLPLGIVIAARFAIAFFIMGDRYGLDPDNAYDLYHLGPPSQQLQGGGSVSNRGVPPGLLGDVVRRRLERLRPPTGIADYPPILVSGGIRRWEGSLELRVPLTPEIGVVLFADVGNVSRGEDFHFDVLNFAFGFGIRYRTLIGPLRFDWAFRPGLDYVGPPDADPRPAPCQGDTDVECRPIHLLFGSVPGAIHLTIGEAF